MKSSLFTTFLIIIFSSNLFSQSKFFMNGVIGIQGGELYSYDMELSETSVPYEYKGVVKTYALIDKEVTAEVTLTININNRTARLLETKIINNKGFQSNATICLVDAALTYDEKNGVLKGPIITQTTGDGSYCAIGNVTFTSTNEINRLFKISSSEPVSQDVQVIPEKPQVQPKPIVSNTPKYIEPEQKIISEKPQEPVNKIQEVTDGKNAIFDWQSDKIILHIWDDNKTDGDRVSVTYNNKEIIYNQLLGSKPIVIELEISGSELNIITILAMSEGSEPPNTAMIRMYDGEKMHEIMSHNKIGKKSIIKIQKKL